jgi:uncharacterized repeat protein (TIGR03803 family)
MCIIKCGTAMAVVLGTALLPPAAHGQKLTTLYSFKGSPDGFEPYGAMVYDQGSLYGTTEFGGDTKSPCGGAPGCGLVFSVNVNTHAETVLYRFTGGNDGYFGAPGLVQHGGLLYGAALFGGTSDHGVVFAVDPGTGAESVLHNFSAGKDGRTPTGGLVFHAGKLYGTTEGGGNNGCRIGVLLGCGTVFSIDLSSGHEKILYRFGGGQDGGFPAVGVTYHDGFLYGTTAEGGGTGCNGNGCGTVYKFDLRTHAESVLYSFTGAPDGVGPNGLTYVGGVLYGTSFAGGTANNGTVFAVNVSTGAESVLHSFAGGDDGANPDAPLLYHGGILYGTTADDGDAAAGTVFTVDPKTGEETLLLSFKGQPQGAGPTNLIAQGADLYGTTQGGGKSGNGTVFRLKP